MADLSDAQRKRAEGRKRRRATSQAEPVPEARADEADGTTSDEDDQPLQAVKQAAKVGAAAAAVGAAAAAARALAHHDEQPAEAPEEEEDTAAPPDDEARAEAEEEPEPQSRDEPNEAEPEPQSEAEPEPDPRQEPEPEQQPEPVEGAAPSDAKATIDRARQQLEELLGRPVESVSSLERTHDGWVVALEVVELARIPESTDVLGSYEMELDGSRNLRRYQQVRRYYRAQADHGEGQ